MFAKVATFFGLFALAAQVAVATPPACLIAAVNTQDNPSDMKTVCTSGASDVQSYLSSNCSNSLDAATSAWASYCEAAGVTISDSTSSSSSSTTGSASLASGTTASSGFVTSTASGSSGTSHSASATAASGSHSSTHAPSATQSGTATATGAASRLGMDVVGLAAVGVFGAMLAL